MFHFVIAGFEANDLQAGPFAPRGPQLVFERRCE